MLIIDLHHVTRILGGRVLFRELDWSIQDGEKIGLIGPNGVGKSTLLRTLAGLEPPEAGAVTLRRGARVAYLPQEYAGEPERAVLWRELLAARTDLAALETRPVAAEARLGDPAIVADLDRLRAGAGRARAPAGAVRGARRPAAPQPRRGAAARLGLTGGAVGAADVAPQRRPAQAGRPGALPAGRAGPAAARRARQPPRPGRQGAAGAHHPRLRRCGRHHLARPLSARRDGQRHRRAGAVARAGARLRRWEGNYSAYATQKELALLRQQQDYVAQQKEIDRLEAAIARFKQWASIVIDERHIKQARNKQRQIDRMDKVERPVLERRKMALAFRPQRRGGARALQLRRSTKPSTTRSVLRDVEATVMNGERVGIVGPNGAGKSVLLRLMLGLVAPDAGEVWVGPSIRLGYYAQQHETLDPARTPVEHPARGRGRCTRARRSRCSAAS